jgi:predicted porin
MKKTLIVAAVATSLSTLAHAQSSVTLYGTVDSGVTYTSNVGGHSQWGLESGASEQSRWGLRGVENLGGGLKTVFDLESGFAMTNGTLANNGGLFNRQAYVGLSHDEIGTVTLGRQYDAMQDYLAPLTATGSWGGTYFAHPFNNDNLNTGGGFAANNSIKFSSVNYEGMHFGGTYGFSNSGEFANNREYSLGAAYQNAGVHFGGAYSQQNYGPQANAQGATSGSLLANPVLSSLRQREFGAGASYAFGPALVGLAWTQSRLDHFGIGGASIRLNNYEVNGSYNLTPVLTLAAAYTYTSLRAAGGAGDLGKAHVNQFGLHTDYALSRRTEVYAQAVYQFASGMNAAIYNGDIGLNSDGSSAASSSSRYQTAVTVGLRHKF